MLITAKSLITFFNQVLQKDTS